ncbi:MAG: HEAT repeat domain-containing protein [Candidatus Obscuribacterales bacterium]|nr:HEAT repeat domain-containing protein [Candidatus Obscuribacterales bacterium]
MQRRIAATVSLIVLSSIAATQSVLAVPGLSSSDSVKKIVNTIKLTAHTNSNDIHTLEQQLRHRPSEAGEALVDLLDTSDPQVKLKAAQLLERLSSNPDYSVSISSLNTIIGILKAADDINIKSSLLMTLGNIGPRSPQVKATIVQTIKESREVPDKRRAIEALARLSREELPELHRQSTEVLIEVLNKDDAPSLRAAAATALSQYHSDPEIAVPALTEALKDNYLKVRVQAVQALGNYQGEGKSAVSALLTMLESESDPNIKTSLIYTLRNIGRDNQEVANAFMKLAEDSPQSRTVFNYLADFGPLMAPMIPRLTEMLKSPDRELRRNAARTLGAMGSAAKDAVPALTKAQEDSDRTVRSYIEQALRNIQGASQGSG